MAEPQQTYRLELDDGTVVAEHVAVATTAWQRTCGLMMRAGLPEGHGLCLRPCKAIHMLFMRFPIDVVFVDKEGAALHLRHGIRPWRMSRVVLRSAAAIELAAGSLAKAGVAKGAILRMV